MTENVTLVVVLLSVHGVIVLLGIIFGIYRQYHEDKLRRNSNTCENNMIDKNTYGDCSKSLNCISIFISNNK